MGNAISTTATTTTNKNNSSDSNGGYEYDPLSKLGMKIREQQIVRHIYRPAAVSKHSNVSIADLIAQDSNRFKKFR